MDSPPEMILSASLPESRCGTSPPGTPATQGSVPSSPSATAPAEGAEVPPELSSLPLHSADSEATCAGTASADSDQPPKTPTHTAPPDLEGLQRTPVELKSSSIRPTSVGLQSGRLSKDEARELYGSEMHFKMVELDFREFLDRYMPLDSEDHELPSESDLKIPDMNKTALLGNTENAVCEELCKVANVILDACPHENRLTARNTSHNPDSGDYRDYGEQLKVDVAIYPTHKDAVRDYGQLAADNHRAPTRWAWISLLMEVKTSSADSPFSFRSKTPKASKASPSQPTDQAAQSGGGPSNPPLKTDNLKASPAEFLRLHTAARQTLGQMTEYVSKVLRRQHRTHFFVVFVLRGRARIVRWDRAGAIVSTPINFAQDPRLLHGVIWRYACMNEAQRGYDPTVVLATEEEIAAMRDCAAPNDWADRYRNGAIGQPGWPIYKITMPNEDLIDERLLQPIADDIDPSECQSEPYEGTPTFIVGKAYFASDSVAGRGTRCFIAYEVARNRLVFLKDYWRPNVDMILAEGATLKKLRTSGVQYVPTPVASGDVYSGGMTPQTSETQSLLSKDERTGRDHVALIHNRLVVKEIGRPLADHEDALQLVGALFYALLAHSQAWLLAQILHRDISELNVIIWCYTTINGQTLTIGLLIDWDLAKLAKYLDAISRPGRSGTWPFMSARLLRYPNKKHEVADDIESAIHLLQWMCFRFYEHNLTGVIGQFKERIMGLFEGYDREKAEKKGSFGGEMKYRDITYGHPTVELLDRNTPLAKLLDDLAKILQRHYLAVEPKCQGPIPARTSTAALSTAGAFVDGLKRAAAKAALGNPKAPAPSTAVLQPAPELMDHQKVLDAFLIAVTGDQIAWQALKKTPDQFEPFKNSAVMQRTRELRSYQSSGSKRESEDDLILQDAAQADRLKRARNETTGLASVSEEHEIARHVD